MHTVHVFSDTINDNLFLLVRISIVERSYRMNDSFP